MKRSERARLAILEHAYTDLMQVAQGSDFIEIETPDRVPIAGWPAAERMEGWPPELYLITFSCTGFSGINDKKKPIRADHHQFAMYLTRDYPASEPKMAWITPIWHPNIDHAGNRHICTNAPETYAALRPLSDLVTFIGEMVQYKRYFAKHEPPWPLDGVVAKWVREIAEPRGWIGPDKPVDPRSLMRGTYIRAVGTPGRAPAKAPEPASPPRIRFAESLRRPVVKFSVNPGPPRGD